MSTGSLTAADLLARNAEARAGCDAVVTSDGSITHDELDRQSILAAVLLRSDGVGKGTRVGLLAENSVEWAVVAAAVMRTGAVLVPLSTLLRPPELEAQLRVAEVEVLVSTGTFRGRDLFAESRRAADAIESVRRVRPLTDVVAVGRSGEPVGSGGVEGTGRTVSLHDLSADRVSVDDVAAHSGSAHSVSAHAVSADSLSADDELVVLFTSGSRGVPKGVIHTHGGAFAAVTAGLDARCVGPDDRIYVPMPFFWTGGFCVGLYTVLVAGCAVLTEAVAEPTTTLAMLEREGATLFRGWPDQASRLAAHPDRPRFDLSSLRPASLPQLQSQDPPPEPGARPSVLGMTETFGPYCMDRLDVDLPRAAWGSNGRPLPGIELRIVDLDTAHEVPEDLAEVTAPGVRGEIWLRGPALLRGICGRSSAEVFTAGGWYRTGDLASVDVDGFVHYAGRNDDMFKVSGASVYPSEVEAALRSVPGVREAHVTDVPGPDGPQVAALVVSDLDVADLTAAARDLLSSFKVPTRWVVTADASDVPRGATGKVDVAGLKALLER